MRVMTLLALTLAAACEPEPVLQDLRPADATSPDQAVADYEKAEGVLVDVQYLTGKSWEAVRDEVSRQMGDMVDSRRTDLPGGYEYKLTRGVVSVAEGRIYQIRVDLDEPLRRSSALAVLGLPPQVSRWGVTHLEFRLRTVWNFDRVRMGRADTETEDVLWVEVRRFNPRAVTAP